MTWTITTQTPRFDGTCTCCGKTVTTRRAWEALLLSSNGEDGKREFAVAHTYCAGGRKNNKGNWTGPSTLTV